MQDLKTLWCNMLQMYVAQVGSSDLYMILYCLILLKELFCGPLLLHVGILFILESRNLMLYRDGV